MSKDFSKLIEKVGKYDKLGSSLQDYQEAELTGFTHTGHYLYNAHLSGSMMRGIPDGRITNIAGDPKTGKSFLSLNIVRNWIERGFYVIIFESEGSPDKKRFESQGIDMSMIRYIQVETSVEVMNIAGPLTKELLEERDKELKKKEPKYEHPKLAILIDSLTNLKSGAQVEAIESGTYKADRGHQMIEASNLLSFLSVRIYKLRIPVVVTQHTKEEHLSFGGRSIVKKSPKGGRGALFMGSVISILTKTDDYDEEKKMKTGIKVRSKLLESRFSKPHDVHMVIRVDKGMNPYLGLKQFLAWEICGIDKGKWAPVLDLSNQFVQKKVFKVDELSGASFNMDLLQNTLSKPNYADVTFHIEKLIEIGEVEAHGDGEFSFTKAVENRIKKNGDKLELEVLSEDILTPIVNQNIHKYIVKHKPGIQYDSVEELYNPDIMTTEVLTQIDEKVIKPYFTLGESEIEDQQDDTPEDESLLTQIMQGNG